MATGIDAQLTTPAIFSFRISSRDRSAFSSFFYGRIDLCVFAFPDTLFPCTAFGFCFVFSHLFQIPSTRLSSDLAAHCRGGLLESMICHAHVYIRLCEVGGDMKTA